MELLHNLLTLLKKQTFSRGLQRWGNSRLLNNFTHLIFPQSCSKTGVHDSQQNVFHHVLVPCNSMHTLYLLSFTTSVNFQQNIFPYILRMTWNNFNHSQWRWKQAKRQEVLLVLHKSNCWQVVVLSDIFL